MITGVVGGILLAGLTLYAALGGADFGGGLWDLLAGGYQRGRAARQLIDATITPVLRAAFSASAAPSAASSLIA